MMRNWFFDQYRGYDTGPPTAGAVCNWFTSRYVQLDRLLFSMHIVDMVSIVQFIAIASENQLRGHLFAIHWRLRILAKLRNRIKDNLRSFVTPDRIVIGFTVI